MKKFVAPAAVIFAGLVFIALTFTQNLFAVGTDFEEMITDFRPALQDEVIATYQADVAGLSAVADEFQAAVLPGLSLAVQGMGGDPDAFVAGLAASYPDVMAGMALLPEAGPQFAGLIGTLEAQQSNFASADQIPTSKFVAQTVPWGFLIVGLLAIGLGVWMLLKGTRLTAILAMVLGVLIVVGSFVLSLPGKSADADDLNEALEPIYTEATIEGAKGALTVIGAMGQQMSAEMVPGLAAQFGMDQAGIMEMLGNFPATAQALQTFPESMARFGQLVDTFDANLDNYETLKPVKFTPIIWTFIAGGFLIIIGGALGFLWKKEEE